MGFFKSKKERLMAESERLSNKLGMAQERASIVDKIKKDRAALTKLQAKERRTINPAVAKGFKSFGNNLLAAAERQHKENERQRKQTPPNTLF